MELPMIKPNIEQISNLMKIEQKIEIERIKIGEKVANGTIYAGRSPVTHTPMYTLAHDLGPMTYKEAVNWASDLKLLINTYSQNKDDIENTIFPYGLGWRLPTSLELDQMFKNKEEIGNFNLEDGYYWSNHANALGCRTVQNFKTGFREFQGEDAIARARFIRIDPK
jgi:hypothetical protein